ncbi:MAG: TonB-dependent receptor plug [Puniceicoccaceae bacterium 5H]|nr:MAG: TonB-dependent receptor plug [Puniceicoccaceae bacterium 5H]
MKLARFSLCWLSAFSTVALCAQTPTNAPEDEDIYELSPFTVDASGDVGYYASETLAGTRIRSDLKDLATSISVVTEDFMADTNSVNIADVLLFQANSEVSGLSGNFSGSQGVTPGDPIGELARDNNSGGVTRLRGLAEADLTREFFKTQIPFDAYNTSRIEVQRGANAALFGLGSAAGIVNNSLIKAEMAGNFGNARLKVDQYGSTREEFRYNVEAIEDVLAVRVALLADNANYEQEEAYDDQHRVFLTTTIHPFGDQTFTVRASGEWGKRDASPPRTMPPADLISGYYALRDAGLPIFNDALEAGTWYSQSGGIYPELNQPNNRWVYPMLGGADGPTVFWLDPNSSEPDPLGARTIQYANELGSSAAYSTTHRMMLSLRNYNNSISLSGAYPDTGEPIAVAGSGAMWDTRTDRQITDRSIFDYRKHLLDGGLSTDFARFEDYIVEVEKLFWDNRLGLNYAYHHESFREGQLNQLRGDPGGESIMIDFNPYLGTTESSLGGEVRVNPNYGGVAVASRAENSISRNERESHRLTAFLSLEANQVLDDGSLWERLLGNVDLTGLYQTRDSNYYLIYTRDTTSPDDIYEQLLGDDPETSFHTKTFYLGQYHALDYSGRSSGVNLLDFDSAEDLKGLNIQPINSGQTVPDQLTFSMLNLTTQSYEDVMLTLYQATDNGGYPATYSGTKGIETIDSYVLNGTWHLLDDIAVFQYAWRRDEWNSSTMSAPQVIYPNGNPGRSDLHDPDFLAGPEYDSTLEKEFENRNWGIVLHTPHFIERHMPAGLNLSLHYGKGQNYQPGGGGLDAIGDSIPNASGETEEWGFTVSGLDNKISARVNFFETGVYNGSFYTDAVAAPQSIMRNLAYQLDNPANIAQGYTAADVQAVLPSDAVIALHGVEFDWDTPDNTTTNPNPNRSATQDFVSEGVEIEILLNPIRKWTTLLKISRQETTTDNTAPVLRRWYNDFVVPNWIESDFAQHYVMDDTSGITLAKYTQDLMGTPLLLAAAQDGYPTVEQREWRYVVTSKYRFEDIFERFHIDGLEIGGTYRYEDEAGIGFPAMIDEETGSVAPDIEHPYMAPSMNFFDVFVNVDTQIGGLETTFQVYVSDLTNHDGLVPIHANPDETYTYRILEGRVISFTASVRF